MTSRTMTSRTMTSRALASAGRILSSATVAVLAVTVLTTPPAAAQPPPSASPTSPTSTHPESASAGVIAAYALAAPRREAASGLVARAVVAAGADCPDLDVRTSAGIRARPMSVRAPAATAAPAFSSITVCTAAVPPSAQSVTVAGRPLPAAMPSRIDRLALVADTGCRIAPFEVQDCASPEGWPLARISQRIAHERPDAVIINGDFFYRESACPASAQALCGASPPPVAGLPITDSDYGWIADALLPMAPLLAAAPIVVTRGNHEACYRGGNGYFLLFDPRTGTEDTCAPVATPAGMSPAPTVPTGTYAIDLAVRPDRTLRLAVVDSAGGSDTAVTAFAAVQRPAYERAAVLTERRPGRESWLLTHRPLYGYVTEQFAVPGMAFNPWTSMDQAAAAYGLLDTYDMVFSSHVHIAQAVQLPGLPGQLLLGNGGTLLDPATGYPLPTSGPMIDATTGYPAPSWAWVAARFGFAIARPNTERGSWRIEMIDPDGVRFARCGLADRQLYCRD